MLTDNTMPTRRWPLVAAAAAVIALVVGGVVAIGTGDDEQIPANPIPTVQPAPDESATDGRSAPSASPKTVTLTGVAQVSSEFEETSPGIGTWTSNSTLTADGVDLRTEASGTFTAANLSWSDGDDTTVATGTIDGIGSGSLTFIGQVTGRGDFFNGELRLTEATGDFEGATGSMSIASRATSGNGTWSMTLTMPGDRIADDFSEPPVTEPLATPQAVATELVAGDETGTTLLEAGSYRTNLLGIPIYFDAPEPLLAWELRPGRIVLSSNDPGDADRGISIGRIGSWFTPEEAVDPDRTGLGSIPADRIDVWLDAHGLATDASFTALVGSTGTQYRALTVPADHPTVYDELGGPIGGRPAGCRRQHWSPCFWAASDVAAVADGPSDWVLGTGSIQQLWLIDLHTDEPLLIRAWVDQPDTSVVDATHWLDDVVPAIVDSIILGPVGPVTADG